MSGTGFIAFSDCDRQNSAQKNKKKTRKQEIQRISNVLWAHMDCNGTNTASGDGGTSRPGFSSILFNAQTPAPGWTQTLTQEEQCTLGKKKKAGWNTWGGARAPQPVHLFPSPFPSLLPQLAQDAGSSMSYMWIQEVSETFHHRPFCFSALQDSWTEQRLPASRRGFQLSAGSSRLQHICVFSHQCEIVQYDGRLMLKQDWYYDLGRIFSYQCFKTFIPSSSYLQSI